MDNFEISEKFLKELQTRFPRLYQKKVWVEFSRGWYPLILELSQQIDYLYNRWNLKYNNYPYVVQMKEKFGGLRFYIAFPEDVSYANEDIEELTKIIDLYERKSYSVCEICSVEGENSMTNGWYNTLCRSCRDERENKK